MFVVDKGGGFEGAGRRLAQRRLKSSVLEGKTLPLRSACLSRIFEAWCAWGLCPSNVSILLKHASGSTGMSQAPKLLLRLTQMRIRQIMSVLSGMLREGTRSRNSSSKQGFLSRTRPCLTVRPVTDPWTTTRPPLFLLPMEVVGGLVEDIELSHKTPPTGDIVPGTVGNLCFEVRDSEVRGAGCPWLLHAIADCPRPVIYGRVSRGHSRPRDVPPDASRSPALVPRAARPLGAAGDASTRRPSGRSCFRPGTPLGKARRLFLVVRAGTVASGICRLVLSLWRWPPLDVHPLSSNGSRNRGFTCPTWHGPCRPSSLPGSCSPPAATSPCSCARHEW